MVLLGIAVRPVGCELLGPVVAFEPLAPLELLELAGALTWELTELPVRLPDVPGICAGSPAPVPNRIESRAAHACAKGLEFIANHRWLLLL